MRVVHIENIPQCFKCGLYTQLVENSDQEDHPISIELPEKYSTFEVKSSDKPTTELLINQLETTRFWCVEEIPQYVFSTINAICGEENYRVLTRDPLFMDYLHAYEPKFQHELRYALHIDKYAYGPLLTCAVYGFQGYFRYLYQQIKHQNAEKIETSKKWSVRSDNRLLSNIIRCQKMAAQHGQISILKILLDIHLCDELLPKLLEMAAMGGQYETMQFLLNFFETSPDKIKWTKHTCHMAARVGNLLCLKLARENGAPYDYLVACAAAENGNFDCYKYLCENGCPLSINPALLNQHICNSSCYTISYGIHTTTSYCMWKHNSCNLAAANGYYNILKYGIEQGTYPTDAAIAYAAKYNHDSCLYYLIDIAMEKWMGIGPPYMSIVLTFIIHNNRFDVLKNIYEKHRYCPFGPDHPNQAADTGNYHMVLYIIEKMEYQHQSYYNNVCRYACYAPTEECVKKLHQAGFKMEIDCIYAAAEKGSHQTFLYVMQNIDYSEIKPEIIFTDLVKRGATESLKYFHSLGYKIHNKSILYCIWSGDYPDCVDFLVKNIQNINIDELICIDAVKSNKYKSLKILHEKHFKPLHGCLYWSVVNNNISILKYLWECGERNITWEMYQVAVKKKYTEIRTFIETNMDVNLLCRQYRKSDTNLEIPSRKLYIQHP